MSLFSENAERGGLRVSGYTESLVLVKVIMLLRTIRLIRTMCI